MFSEQIITAHPYRGETDLQPIADLLNICEAVDQAEEGISAEELREEFNEPGFDPARDLRLWEDSSGQLLGFAQIWRSQPDEPLDAFVWFRVHPQARGSSLGEQMLAWANGCAREHGTPLRAMAWDTETTQADLLARNRFQPIRYFLRMNRSLELPIPQPHLPAGFTIADGNHDPAEWAALYNESFVDHWSFHPMNAERVAFFQSESIYRPDLNLVVISPEGQLVAFAWNSIRPAENQRSGRLEGRIGLLGTRRGFRKLGLGRALLYESMQRLRDAGMQFATLGVDAESLTGATRLYESVGFQVRRRRTIYQQQKD